MQKQLLLLRSHLMLLTIVILALTSVFAETPLAPYLQAVSLNSVEVLVDTPSQAPVTVLYGANSLIYRAQTSEIFETNAKPATYVHHIKISGLAPHTYYYYEAIQNGKKSALYSFTTSAPLGVPIRFAWMADCRTGVAVHRQIAALIREAKPDFSLYGGDLCRTPDYRNWQQEFFVPEELALDAEVPFFSIPGNHERWEQNTKAFTHSPDSFSKTPAYFSFDYGDAHFLAINNELPTTTGSPQYQFIQNDLASTNLPWKIVFAHHPAYCSGGHGKNHSMIKLSKSIFKKYDVDLVIAGHSHFYQHNVVDGIRHLVIGSAGAPLASPEEATYTVKSAQEYCFAIANLSRGKLQISVYNNHGEPLDEIVLRK